MTLAKLIHELIRLQGSDTTDWPVTMLIDRIGGQVEAPVSDIAKSRDRIILIFEEEVHGPLRTRNITEVPFHQRQAVPLCAKHAKESVNVVYLNDPLNCAVCVQPAKSTQDDNSKGDENA